MVAPAELFGELAAEQYDWLKAQIQRDGQRDPIYVTAKGEIVDGRHRARICAELGLKPTRVVVKGTREELVREAIARNLPTRLMTMKARKEFAVMLVIDEGWTHEAAADVVGVDRRTVERAIDALRAVRADAQTPQKRVRDGKSGETADVRRRRDTVTRLRENDGMSVRQVAIAMGVDNSTVRKDMRARGLGSDAQHRREDPPARSVPWRTPTLEVPTVDPSPPPQRQYKRSLSLQRIDGFNATCKDMNICNCIAFDYLDAEEAGDQAWITAAQDRVALLVEYAARLADALTPKGAERAALTNYGRDDIPNDL